jgi:phosphoribosylanthranilate isomerase
VDVSSGIEERPGEKDPLLMEAFMTEIKSSEGT